MDRQQIPAGVKIISVLYYISAIFALIIGLVPFLSRTSEIISKISIFGLFNSGLIISSVIILIGIIVLNFFIGRGLWKGQNWSRIAAIIFASLGVLGAVIPMIQGKFTSIIGLVISLVIGGYLMFNSRVKAAF